MRKIVFVICWLLFSWAYAGQPSLELVKLRDLYYKASADKDDSEKFYTYLQNNPGVNDAVFSAYSGMSYMIKAKHSWNPYNKLSFFSKGKDKLEEAIKLDQLNPELRFLRFCIQTNAPGFLGYSSKIKEDKAILVVTYPTLTDADLKKRIGEYMRNSDQCTETEKKIFK